MAKKVKEEVLNLDNILFKCRDILRQAKNSGSFFEKRDMMHTDLCDFAGACRFYAGLAKEIKVVDSPEFLEYVRGYVKENLEKV